VIRPAVLLACLTTLALPGTALAQAYECRTDEAPITVRSVTPDGPVRHMPVASYTLVLSWSPEFCRQGQIRQTRQSRASDAMQCSGRHGRFGLIVHGLWPEGAAGRWPQWCPSPHRPSPRLLRRNLCMTPSAQLLAREWAKHGSCMARTPEAYFAAAEALWESVEPRLPDLDLLSRREGLTAGRLREAFVAANPAWRTDQLGIHLNRRGWLEEVRLCYGRDFLPARCSGSQLGAGDSQPAKIWRGL